MFGGSTSKNYKNGKFVNSDDSINAVVAVIELNEQDYLNGGMITNESRLKDKMIALVAPSSAMKNGITNINPVES